MKAYLNSISGIDDAIVAMHISKRHIDRETETDIRNMCSIVQNRDGSYISTGSINFIMEAKKREVSLEDINNLRAEYEDYMTKLCKWGAAHTTLLRFIDLSFMVYGMHRAGQDDWDAHACRYDNRIIRSSSRLAEFEQDEMSDYYKDKIITTNDALSILEINTPDKIVKDGKTYVKSVNGYILEEMKNNKDVKRGLYMLSIPSNFIFRVNLCEFAHVYKERNINGGANPEVKELAEQCADLLEMYQPLFTRELLLNIKN